MVCKGKCEYEQVYKLSVQKERKSCERNDVYKQVENTLVFLIGS